VAALAAARGAGAAGAAGPGREAASGTLGVPGGGGWPFPVNSCADRGLGVSLGLDAAADGDEGASLLDAVALHAKRGPEMAAAVRAAEAGLWGELDAIVDLSTKVNSRQQTLPAGIECLRPPPGDAPPGDAGGGAGPRGASVDAEYPALRRAARLSFAALSVLGDTSRDEGRQAWLETNGLVARLSLVRRMLAQHRRVLAAMSAVRGAVGDGEGGAPGA